MAGGSGGSSGGGHGGDTQGSGAASGCKGGNGITPASSFQRLITNSGYGTDGNYLSGAGGKQGGSFGETAGNGGLRVILICTSITGTDGKHTGII